MRHAASHARAWCLVLFQASVRPVVQPAQAQEKLAALSNYAKVFHPAFVKPQGLEAAWKALEADPQGGKFFFRPVASRKVQCTNLDT